MAIGRGDRDDGRQRREFQRLNRGLGFEFGDGLVYDNDAGTIAIDITPNTDGILTFSGGDLTTQFITTSGATPSVSVTVAATNNLTMSATNDVEITSAVGSAVRLQGGALIGRDSTAESGFLFDASGAGEAYFYGPAGTMRLIGGVDCSATSGQNIRFFGGPLSGGIGGEVSFRGGDGVAVNEDGGTILVGGGKPNGTGTSRVEIGVYNTVPVFQARIECNTTGVGFFGTTPIARPGTYTLTAGTPAAASFTLNASGNSGAAFTGINNLQVGTVYAQLTDLNTLRTECANLAAVLRQVIRNLGDTAGFGLLNDTGY